MPSEAHDRVKREIDRMILRSSFPEEPFHAINTVEWLEKLAPDADDNLRLAALGHDIERACDDRRIRSVEYDSYDDYKLAHARNSAEILTEIMADSGMTPEDAADIANLVANHETGGGPRTDVLMYADMLSFFAVCLPLYYDRKGPETTRRRAVWGYKKLPAELRGLVAAMEDPDPELDALIREALGL